MGPGQAIQLLAMGSSPTPTGADLQQEVLLSAAAGGVRTAWECSRGKAKSGVPGGIMAGTNNLYPPFAQFTSVRS